MDWLVCLKWLECDDQYVRITALGEVVLSSMEETAAEPDGPVVSILESKDALAYATVIGNIGKRGKALLVDPYFKLDALPHVLQFTEVTRVLVGPQADVPALGAALATLASDRPFEIRVSETPHDRFVIPEAGSVDALGTSLNGVGRRFSVMFEIRPPQAEGIRRACEEMWNAAQSLTPPPVEEEADGGGGVVPGGTESG